MKPCVLIGSCHNEVIPPQRIVKGILELEADSDLSPCEAPIEDVTAYPWSIKTKYYEADVNICTMNTRTLGSKEFAESVNAIIICFDSVTCSELSPVQQWLPFIKEFEPEVKILVCECCSTTDESGSGIDKVAAQEWCIDHGFELVELSPIIEEDDDVEDDFPECLGMKRIIQALHAHLWPNLTMIEKKRQLRPPQETEALAVPADEVAAAAAACTDSSDERPSNQSKPSNSVADKIDSLLEGTLSGSDETFEELFGKLSEMKLKTEGMTLEERRAYAEKMAISFWKSMGGNDSEIDGLSSEED